MENIEPFGNPLDTPFEFYTDRNDINEDSAYRQDSICVDDSSWKNEGKTCRDYSIKGADCFEPGDNGSLAYDACKVACDNCPGSVQVKRREPSPVEDTDEPLHAVFEVGSGIGDSGIGPVDIEISLVN
jgi:hypothetical protein